MYLNWSICLIKVAQHREHRFGDVMKVNFCQRCRVGCCRASHEPPAAGNSRLLKWLKWHTNYLGKFEEQASMLRLAIVPTPCPRGKHMSHSCAPHSHTPCKPTFPRSSRFHSKHATIVIPFHPGFIPYFCIPKLGCPDPHSSGVSFHIFQREVDCTVSVVQKFRENVGLFFTLCSSPL